MPVINISAQSAFIKQLKEAIPANVSLVEELAEILEISTDSAYRRIRGETSLSIDEAVILCNRYKISFDSFNNNTQGTVTFNYKPLVNGEDNFKDYLENISNDLKRIASFKNKEIIFAAEDIPIFHHFAYKELTAFKIFYWNKSILNSSQFEGKKFDASYIDKGLINTATDILTTYLTIPSVEIWSEDTVNSTIKQIEFYWESGQFKSKEDALLICAQAEEMLRGIISMAEQSRKFLPGAEPGAENNYTLYNSELMIGNNCVLVNMDGMKVSYLSHHTFNAMITTNTAFCNDTDAWLKNLMKKSILISGVSEKQRYKFFKHIFEKFDLLKSKIA